MHDDDPSLRSFADGVLSWNYGNILVIDVVESVRLMAGGAGGAFIRRWVALRNQITTAVTRQQGARVVRSTGDGIICQFDEARTAVALGFQVFGFLAKANAESTGCDQIALRLGIAAGEFLADDSDIYGQSVNLAARLAGLAPANGIVVAEAVAAHLIDGVDGRLTDLGPCYVKHVETPLRAFAIQPLGENLPPRPARRADGRLIPTIAVIPPTPLSRSDQATLIGDIIADDLIRSLSGSALVRVVSRLSSGAFRGRSLESEGTHTALGADFLISGACAIDGSHVDGTLTLTGRDGQLLAANWRYRFTLAEIVDRHFNGFDSFVTGALRDVLRAERRRMRRQAIPNLSSQSLLLSAISLMHRPAQRDFLRAFDLLDHLIQRHSRETLPHAWMASWYSLKAAKGLSGDRRQDGERAAGHARAALDIDPEDSLSLSVAGLIATNFAKDFTTAERLLDEATASNPNDAGAALHLGALHMFTDRGTSGYALSQQASALSPCDPHRYYFEAIAASAAFVAGDYATALGHADEALRNNRLYTPGLRVRTAALWWLGRLGEARAAAADLIDLEPGLTVQGWLGRSPAADYENGRRIAEGLRGAGIAER